MDTIRGQRELWCFACEKNHHNLCIGECACGDTHPTEVWHTLTRKVA